MVKQMTQCNSYLQKFTRIEQWETSLRVGGRT